MSRDRKTGNGAKPSPEARYREFAKDNAAWDRKVKESIDKIGQASRRSEQKRAAAGG